jgi:Leucine-rich repeat (LRR) protein
MIKFIIFLMLCKILNAQIHLNRTNLAYLCNCDPLNTSSIRLSNQNIKTIDPDTFTGLTFLQRLTLSGNHLSVLNASTFHGLTSLRELYISSNQISSIDPGLFNGLVSLQEKALNEL